ncbi:hypothetical protein [Streptacidiphilus neutrinimicus]|uniref:hypothetical protein n=1 Tax=Streptacidiphilus neutrinimicus TaxID=105420 RepID=UPI0005AB3908|nr:hypothetical protein [Streptacidiphilus neutrinimicus]
MPLLPTTPAGRRSLAGLVALLAISVLAAFGARLAGHHGATARGQDQPAATVSPVTAPSSTAPDIAGPAVPHTTDPVTFARDFTGALWSYDTTTTPRNGYLTGLGGWLTTETKYADPGSVSGQVPSTQLWTEMARQHQHASANGLAGHIPAQFTTALNADPGALSVAYIYAVTVTGTQAITWDGGRGTENRSITLAVQCRPDRDCALAAIAPTVYP